LAGFFETETETEIEIEIETEKYSDPEKACGNFG
jgi:hypothetical protein